MKLMLGRCRCVGAKDNRLRVFPEMKIESFSSRFALPSHEHLNDAAEYILSQLREGFNANNIGNI